MILTKYIEQNKNKNYEKIDVNNEHRMENIDELDDLPQVMKEISITQNLHALQLWYMLK
jgi:hypothetical protein